MFNPCPNSITPAQPISFVTFDPDIYTCLVPVTSVRKQTQTEKTSARKLIQRSPSRIRPAPSPPSMRICRPWTDSIAMSCPRSRIIPIPKRPATYGAIIPRPRHSHIIRSNLRTGSEKIAVLSYLLPRSWCPGSQYTRATRTWTFLPTPNFPHRPTCPSLPYCPAPAPCDRTTPTTRRIWRSIS